MLFSLTEEFTFPAFLSMKIAKFNWKIMNVMRIGNISV
jgi:hypothetical protein